MTDFDAMALKTVLRRLCKFLPLSIEAQTAVALDETHEHGLPQDLGVAWLDVPPAPVDDAGAAGPESPAAPTKLDAALAKRQKSEPPDAVA